MEVFYKFKSAKDFVSIPIDWHYTTASDVKQYVLENKCSGKRNKAYLDKLTLTYADTNNEEDYLDGETLIPKNSFLIIRRAPRFPCLPIVVNPPVQLEETKSEEADVGASANSFDFLTESEWIEFWNDLSPSTVLVPVQSALPSKAEERKIKDLIDNPALDGRQCHSSAVSFGAGRGFGHGGIGGGFGQGGLSHRITPPLGYICHRCKVPGHFIQHCPTNGDPSFDIRRTKPPTGDPCSILMDSSAGSNALSGGGVAVFKPTEATFEKTIQGLPSTRSVAKIPAELYCPLCRAVMKDAVLASKCCFKSFCDKCIRDYITSKSLCICGAINVLAGDLLPNKTLRAIIVRFLKSTNSNEANDGSSFQPQDMESAPGPQPNIPCSSAPSKGVLLSPKSEVNTKAEEITELLEPIEADDLGKLTVGKGVEVSKAVHSCSSAPSKGVVISKACISFPEMESPVYKKRKLGNSSPSVVSESSHHRCHSTTSNGYHEDQCKTAAAVSKNNYNYADDHIYELGDDDRHFKGRSSRYESSPPRAVIKGRHSSRGWREKGVTAANISRLSVY